MWSRFLEDCWRAGRRWVGELSVKGQRVDTIGRGFDSCQKALFQYHKNPPIGPGLMHEGVEGCAGQGSVLNTSVVLLVKYGLVENS